jgi:hypothetical protein
MILEKENYASLGGCQMECVNVLTTCGLMEEFTAVFFGEKKLKK